MNHPEIRRRISPEDDAQATEIISIIDLYLSSQSQNAGTAAKLLAECTERNITPGEEYDAAGPVYQEILYRVRTMKHDDPRQEALVVLVASLKSFPGTKLDWTSLNPLGITIRELWNGALDENSPSSWASLNAFAARLTTSEVLSFDVYSIWAFRPALEEDLNVDELNGNLPAAAVWFVYASARIWHLCTEGEEIGPAARGGSKWKGRNRFGVERWEFWLERLRATLNTDGLDTDAKHLVDKALVTATSTAQN